MKALARRVRRWDRFARSSDHVDMILVAVVRAGGMALIWLPALAHAQGVGSFGDGVTQLLKTVVNLVVFEWGYYLGIILLAIQGYRWKTGRCDLMELGRWGLGIILVFFAPNIVSDIRSRAGGAV